MCNLLNFIHCFSSFVPEKGPLQSVRKTLRNLFTPKSRQSERVSQVCHPVCGHLCLSCLCRHMTLNSLCPSPFSYLEGIYFLTSPHPFLFFFYFAKACQTQLCQDFSKGSFCSHRCSTYLSDRLRLMNTQMLPCPQTNSPDKVRRVSLSLSNGNKEATCWMWSYYIQPSDEPDLQGKEEERATAGIRTSPHEHVLVSSQNKKFDFCPACCCGL